jgi:perosamine synthetase
MKSVTQQVEVPFHRAMVGEEEVEAVANVIRSGWLTMGPRTIEFEEQFGRYIGAEYCIAVNSCTAALHLALDAIGLQPGDEVLVPTNTFTATGETVAYMGAKPALVDIDPRTLNLDVLDAKRRLTPRTKAIIPVHLSGQPCDMDEIHAFAEQYGLHVVEDAAHALPASYQGKNVGAISEITTFSFYATKTLTTGEGGMIATNDMNFADRMRIMRLHGIGRDAWKRYSKAGSWRYAVLDAGFKYNLTDMASALGLVQLKRCDQMALQRSIIAARYHEAFSFQEALETPTVKTDRQSAWHLYVLRLNLEKLSIGRDEFIEELRKFGIEASVHFIPLHLHPYYQKKYGYKHGDFVVAEREYERYLSLPIFPGMTDAEIEAVISSVLAVVRMNLR